MGGDGTSGTSGGVGIDHGPGPTGGLTFVGGRGIGGSGAGGIGLHGSLMCGLARSMDQLIEKMLPIPPGINKKNRSFLSSSSSSSPPDFGCDVGGGTASVVELVVAIVGFGRLSSPGLLVDVWGSSFEEVVGSWCFPSEVLVDFSGFSFAVLDSFWELSVLVLVGC